MPSILFVCTANRFRSPLAAAFLIKSMGKSSGETGWRVESAGTWTEPGLPASAAAITIGEQLDLPGLKSHLTRQVSKELLDGYDLVLTMERGQLEAILSEFRDASGRTMLLSEVVDGLPYDIPDPIDLSNDPGEVASELEALIDKGADKILKTAAAKSLSRGIKPPG